MLNELNFLRASSAFEFCLLNKIEVFAFLCTYVRMYVCGWYIGFVSRNGLVFVGFGD